MTAFNVVRFRVKPGEEQVFEETFRALPRDFAGLKKFALIRTGACAYFSVGEWDSFDHIVDARSQMIRNLDSFRHTLEEIGDAQGFTDAVSGEAIFETALAP